MASSKRSAPESSADTVTSGRVDARVSESADKSNSVRNTKLQDQVSIALSSRKSQEQTKETKFGNAQGAAEKLTGEALFQRSTIDSIKRLDQQNQQPIKLGQNGKLGPGDYEVQFKNGRFFQVHVPPHTGRDLPVMMAIPGALGGCLNPRKFVSNLGLVQQADRKESPFILVTPFNEKHRLTPGSLLPSWAWNLPGALVAPRAVDWHVSKVGYDDSDYFAGLMKLIPNLTDSTRDHRKWGYSAFSQGSAALYRLAGSERFKDKIQNIYVISGTMEASDKELGSPGQHTVAPYKSHGGANSKHLMLIDTAADRTILPHWNRGMSKAQQVLAKAFVETWLGLSAVDHKHQAPEKQELTQLGLPVTTLSNVRQRLGSTSDFTVKVFEVSECKRPLKTEAAFKFELKNQSALDNSRKNHRDIRWEFISKHDQKTLTVYELPKAKHAIPGPAIPGWNFIPTYSQFNTAVVIADDFGRRVRNLQK